MKSYDLTFWRLDLKDKANSNEKLGSLFMRLGLSGTANPNVRLKLRFLAPRPKGQS